MPIMIERGVVIEFLDDDGNEVDLASPPLHETVVLPYTATHYRVIGTWEQQTGRAD